RRRPRGPDRRTARGVLAPKGPGPAGGRVGCAARQRRRIAAIHGAAAPPRQGWDSGDVGNGADRQGGPHGRPLALDHGHDGERGAGRAAQAPLSPAASYRSVQCSAGAHTLAPPGSHLYPETGNGGYTSVHTLVHLVYDAAANEFLPGNQVVLTDRATQCLSSFSLDFERKSANTRAGPDMTVRSVTVNGQRARFTFVHPTYPGDPPRQNHPNPPPPP